MLTRRGASLLLAIALFSFIGWVSGSPIFAITSLTLVLLVLIESLQLKYALHVVKKLESKLIQLVGQSFLPKNRTQ